MIEKLQSGRTPDAPEPFERALDEIQEKLGYRFNDRQLLRYAMTRNSSWESRGVGMQYVEHSQKELEREGDRLLRGKVDAWRKKLPDIKNSGPVFDFFNSNLFFSTVALRLGMQDALRLDFGDYRDLNHNPGPQQEWIAAMLEACIGAIARDAGEGADKVINELLEKHLFAHEKTRDVYLKLCAGTASESLKLFQGMVKGTAVMKPIYFKSNGKSLHKAKLSALGLESVGLKRGRASEDLAVSRVIIKFLMRHPWILWGYEGSVSIRMPLVEKRAVESSQSEED